MSLEPPATTAALDYARRGWHVFPVHGIVDGGCTCGGRPGCEPGKHPLTAHGHLDATTDAAAIRGWWERWPWANVAIATGSVSGIVVVDVDPQHGGGRSLGMLEERHGPVPTTPKAATGGGGRHLFFAHPGVPVKTSAGQLGPGLDIRGDGGYVVAPPSLHASGRQYRWEVYPDDVPPAPLPPWLLALALDDPRTGRGPAPAIPEVIREGERNATLVSLAGSMRRRGIGHDTILAPLQAVNEGQCEPPLPEEEMQIAPPHVVITGERGRWVMFTPEELYKLLGWKPA